MSRTSRNKTYIPRDAQFTRYRTKVKTAVKDTIARESSRELEYEYEQDMLNDHDISADEYIGWLGTKTKEEISEIDKILSRTRLEGEQSNDWDDVDYFEIAMEEERMNEDWEEAERGQLLSDLKLTSHELQAWRDMRLEERGPKTMTDLRAIQLRWLQSYRVAVVTRLMGGELERFQEYLLEYFDPDSMKLAPRGVEIIIK